MPSWMLRCPKCTHEFVYAAVGAAALLECHRDPFGVVCKPDFDAEGETRECPGCKKESLFPLRNLHYFETR
jgi:hypothetical protein